MRIDVYFKLGYSTIVCMMYLTFCMFFFLLHSNHFINAMIDLCSMKNYIYFFLVVQKRAGHKIQTYYNSCLLILR